MQSLSVKIVSKVLSIFFINSAIYFVLEKFILILCVRVKLRLHAAICGHDSYSSV